MIPGIVASSVEAENFGDAVWDAARSAGSTVFVKKVSDAQWVLYQQMGDGIYSRITIETRAGLPGSKTPIAHQINDIIGIVPALKVEDSDGSFTYSGAGWTTLSGQHRNATTGSYFEWVTSSAAESVCIWYSGATNQGLGLVQIDGDRTRADCCVTAQYLVDQGLYANTILVANGGTLNPTDRVIDFATANMPFSPKVMATGLATGATKTVRVTVTGYKRPANTDVRIVVDGMGEGNASTTPATSSAVEVVWQRVNHQVATAQEGAIRLDVDGIGDGDWVGNWHGYEQETSWSVTINGGAHGLSDGQVGSGTLVQMIRGADLYHPQVAAGATVIGSWTVTYTFSQDGLHVEQAITWASSFTVTTAYLAMMSLQEFPGDTRYVEIDRGSSSAITSDVVLTANDDSRPSMGEADTVWMWGAGDRFFAAIRIDDLANLCANFTYDGSERVFIEDRSGATPRINKVYFPRASDTTSSGQETVANGTTWNPGGFTYRFRSVPSADAVCSRP